MTLSDTRTAIERLVPRGSSLLDVDAGRTVAIDGGAQWTGVVCLDGADVAQGWCVGFEPGRKWTRADIDALRLDPLDPWLDYYDRVYDVIDTAVAMFALGTDPAKAGVRIVFEDMAQPLSATYGKGRKRRRVPLATWVPVRELNAGIAARYPGAFGVPGGFAWGNRQQPGEGGSGDWRSYYPPQLVRRVPEGWTNDHPDRLRNHERAAFDVGKVAQVLLSAGAFAEVS